MRPKKQSLIMEGKDSICKILRSLQELEIPLKRDLLIDYIIGRESKDIVKKGLDNTENYGCGDDKDEDYWMLILDKVLELGFLKSRSEGICLMSKGKKYLKKPTPIEISEEEEEEQVGNIEGLVGEVLNDGTTLQASPTLKKPTTSQRKMALIQAVDRHVALDDFASNHGMDFEEVMEDVENIIASGTKLDLNYFGEEVLGNEAMSELFDYYESAPTDKLEKAIDEYGDVYSYDELRLGRILWRASKL